MEYAARELIQIGAALTVLGLEIDNDKIDFDATIKTYEEAFTRLSVVRREILKRFGKGRLA